MSKITWERKESGIFLVGSNKTRYNAFIDKYTNKIVFGRAGGYGVSVPKMPKSDLKFIKSNWQEIESVVRQFNVV